MSTVDVVDVNTVLDDAAAARKDGRSGVIGKPIDRVDGRKKITGAARYAAEFRHDRLTHAVMVQSTIAKGKILSIDAAAAKRAPGVIAVLSHLNTPKFKEAEKGAKADPLQSGKMGEDRLPFSDDVIHYAGQHVALVVADTLDHARHAASLVKVRYQEEKPVLTVEEAEPDAYMPKASFGRPLQHERGDVEAALAAPGVVKLQHTYTTPVADQQPHGALGHRRLLGRRQAHRRGRHAGGDGDAGDSRAGVRHPQGERPRALPVHRRRLRL